MASGPFSLALSKRKQRFELIRFFELLHLALISGYELAHAWDQTVKILNLKDLENKTTSTNDHLMRLSRVEHLNPYGRWFHVLALLYTNGAGMADAVQGVAQALRKEEGADLESHLRNLPSRMQVLLILFFFPPTILLLLLPLLGSLNAV